MAKTRATPATKSDPRPVGPGDVDTQGLPFEQAISRLSSIVVELEAGELSLEESLARFEEGVRLARLSQKQLDEAESKVEQLLSVDALGVPSTEDVSES